MPAAKHTVTAATFYDKKKGKFADQEKIQQAGEMIVNKGFGPIHDYLLGMGISVQDDEFKKILQNGDNKDEQLKLKEPVFGWVTYKVFPPVLTCFLNTGKQMCQVVLGWVSTRPVTFWNGSLHANV